MPEMDKGSAGQEIQLTGVLAEFRIALRAEIKAAERQASANAIPLTSGERVGKIGHLLQYRFSVDSFLNLPGEMPGDLVIPGSAPIPTTIVAVEGLNITLSVEADLPKFIPHARLKTNLTYLLRRLIERVEDMAKKPNPAGERIRGAAGARGQPKPVAVHGLNPEQQSAVASSLGRDTTFIWGPPGTGKTYTIGRVGEQLCRGDRSLLLVSHTNIAVDGALLQIAKFLGQDLKEGQVIRVGTPRPESEELLKREDLLLDKLVEKREAELAARKASLQSELDGIRRELGELQKTLALCEWVQTAGSDLEAAGQKLASLGQLEVERDCLRSQQEELEQEDRDWRSVVEEALDVRSAKVQASESVEEVNVITAHCEADSRSVAAAESELLKTQGVLAGARELEPLRKRQDALPSPTQSRTLLERLNKDLHVSRYGIKALQKTLSEAESILARTVAANPLTRLWKGLPKPDVQAAAVETLRRQLQQSEENLELLEKELDKPTATLKEAEDLESALKPHQKVPRLGPLLADISSLTEELSGKRASLDRQRALLDAKKRELNELLAQISSFQTKHGVTPEQAVSKGAELERRLTTTAQEADNADASYAQLKLDLETDFERWLQAVRAWELTEEDPVDLEGAFQAVAGAYEQAAIRVEGVSVPLLCEDIKTFNSRATEIQLHIAAIDQQLAKLAEKLIAEAKVVAATLTGAYLRDAIQARRFDTVILDEASMAPIPALWIAASLATANVVAVGDFKQLPPIVLADNDECARRWLGRDIFEAAAVTQGGELRLPSPSHFVELLEQRRMHPKIRSIPGDLIYEGRLRDGPNVTNEDQLKDWYRFDWGHDSPVLLVDTAKTKAWVTSVAKGANYSRLNFLSATVCVDLAERLFREGFLDTDQRAERRILIVCPYNPHAKLLRLLLKHQGLENHVQAGTVHSFQGSEASVVIFDLVNDEPHWKVGLFMPVNDGDNRRLINVALTRAQHRLFIVGDFDYCERLSRKAFLGRTVIPYLRTHFPTVDAFDVIPPGLAARAARADSRISGGDVEPPFMRTVVTQVDFYRVLSRDMNYASQRVVIYSPFLTQDRLGAFEPSLKALTERGVPVYVITKAHEERGKVLQQYRFLEQTLGKWGIRVIHKLRMHEKLVLIDDKILWSGSLNPLSYSDTQEVMERRESAEVVRDYSSTLRLDELLIAYEAGEVVCPVCGREVMAAEGVEEPYYWRCVIDGCFSRSIGQTMPKDGRLVCANCGGDLEFGEWGDRYVWRCVENPRHRLRIHRHHLKLPKMAALVPKRHRRALEKHLAGKLDFVSTPPSTQTELF